MIIYCRPIHHGGKKDVNFHIWAYCSHYSLPRGPYYTRRNACILGPQLDERCRPVSMTTQEEAASRQGHAQGQTDGR